MRVATLHRRTHAGAPVLEGDATQDIKRGSLIRLLKNPDGSYRIECIAGPRKINHNERQALLTWVQPEWLTELERNEQ